MKEFTCNKSNPFDYSSDEGDLASDFRMQTTAEESRKSSVEEEEIPPAQMKFRPSKSLLTYKPPPAAVKDKWMPWEEKPHQFEFLELFQKAHQLLGVYFDSLFTVEFIKIMRVTPQEILEINAIDKNLPDPMPVWASTGDYETNFVAQVSINLIL